MPASDHFGGTEKGNRMAAKGINHLVTADGQPTAPHPTLLYGYGSYEVSIDPSFSSLRLSLLDRGMVFAIAHIRGGGEMGRAWYQMGRLSSVK